MMSIIQKYRALAGPALARRGGRSVGVVGLLLVSTGCASIARVGEPDNALAREALPPERIRWPAQYAPEDASFFVHNEREIAAPPEVVWDILVRADEWPRWYEGAEDVQVLGASGGVLTASASFSWSTMGLDFTSTIAEFVPPYRLSWESRKATIKGYHAWLIIPTATGCKVVTEESQYGFMTLMQKIFVPNDLHDLHDVWLAGLAAKAEAAVRGATATSTTTVAASPVGS
jgi:uncharacterized protein YndB with AHSA1/START domain